MPRVTAIIPVYNGAKFVSQAIESVLTQTFSDWEIVLVDDGSTDETRATVQPYIARAGEMFRYVYQENQGLAAARNTAIRHARSDLLALLDADDVWEPDRLAHSVAALDGSPAAGLAHGKVIRMNADGGFIDIPPADPRYLNGKIAKHIYMRRAHIQCPTVTFRKACIDAVGGFDRDLRATEDRDLWFRIAERFDVVFVDRVLARYRMSPNSMSRDLDRMRTAQLQFVKKHRGGLGNGGWAAFHVAMASIHREQGDALFPRKPGKALRHYAAAAAHNPFDSNNLYMLIRAIARPF